MGFYDPPPDVWSPDHVSTRHRKGLKHPTWPLLYVASRSISLEGETGKITRPLFSIRLAVLVDAILVLECGKLDCLLEGNSRFRFRIREHIYGGVWARKKVMALGGDDVGVGKRLLKMALAT
jgi:hypothetical protein